MTDVKKRRALEKGAKMHSDEDVLCSYTGVNSDPYEKPVQDADDL